MLIFFRLYEKIAEVREHDNCYIIRERKKMRGRWKELCMKEVTS